jgi:hypothetical protein
VPELRQPPDQFAAGAFGFTWKGHGKYQGKPGAAKDDGRRNAGNFSWRGDDHASEQQRRR